MACDCDCCRLRKINKRLKSIEARLDERDAFAAYRAEVEADTAKLAATDTLLEATRDALGNAITPTT